ncbi:MAG: MoxR family ATPase [Bacteroidota bacterium]|uniref:AAA family ATPase n=1 Tax=Runella sp. TaxID=1960881 RepID=UPI00301ACDDA
MSKQLTYTGTGLLTPKKYQDMDLKPYLPDPNLIEAVNIAIYLQRPLLIKGEPGCGKSYLAKAVACELGLPYYEFNVKSTSKAKDALYSFNHVAHLRDAQLASNGLISLDDVIKHEKSRHYVNPGPLGKAFTSKKRAVLLIDEIDKADIDFPNDLLNELEDMKFSISELEGRTDEAERTIQADPANRPILFITSNDEKDLPAPFLRRCLYYQIKFPEGDDLKKILRAHIGLDEVKQKALVDKAIERFEALREEMKSGVGDGKKSSTSELIDWYRALSHDLKDEDALLKRLENELPFPGVLIKNKAMYERYLAQ